MKLTIKTLQQKILQIDADGSDTIGDVKAKIAEAHGHPVEQQKLIYSGKVLPDTKTVESCEIKEKDFLVLMVSKAKLAPVETPAQSSTPATTPAPPPAQSQSVPPTAVSPAPAEASTQAPATATTTAPAPTPAQQDTTASAPSAAPTYGASFIVGEALQTTINNMVEMGFERDQVLKALKAAYNNPDRAVEYLMTGIPQHLVSESSSGAGRNQPATPATPAAAPAAPAAASPPAQQPTATQPAAAPNAPQNLFTLAQQRQQQQQTTGGINPLSGLRAPGGGGAGSGLEGLRSDNHLEALRELVRQNPALIQPAVQQLAQNNPQLAQLLAENPEAFLQLLGEGQDDNEIPPGAQVISITPEEGEAIQRLEALGFPRQAAIEAYLACDKNEELAANYLFEGGFEDNP